VKPALKPLKGVVNFVWWDAKSSLQTKRRQSSVAGQALVSADAVDDFVL